ncbi:hypothetical protein D3C85_1618130 [compost metagenome]
MGHGHALFILCELREFTTTGNPHIGVTLKQIAQRGFQPGLVKEVDDRPAIGAIEAPVLAEDLAIGQHPLSGRIDLHVG